MRNIQEVFNNIQEKRKEQKELKKIYRDMLEGSSEYRELIEKLEQLRSRKKQLEAQAWEEAGSKNKYETSKLDIKQDREMLSDLAITTLMNGYRKDR